MPMGLSPRLAPDFYVSRELPMVVPFYGNDDATAAAPYLWTAAANQPVRGMALGLLNVRRAQVMALVPTAGDADALPIYDGAAYAASQPDGEGFPTFYAFGGYDGAGAETASLFRAAPVYAGDGSVSYVWTRLLGVGPTPRRNAAIAVNAAGTRIYVVGGRKMVGANSVPYGDVWRYEIDGGWTELPLTATLASRYDAAVALRGDNLYLGGGIDATGTALGDLVAVDGLSGEARSYGGVLPTGGRPYLAFDEHGDGLVYGGGYVGSTWYRDLWRISLTATSATTAFLYDFSGDGMPASENFALVPDLEHGVHWAVPGHTLGGSSAQGVWFYVGGSSRAQQPGSDGPLARAAASGGSAGIVRAAPATRPRPLLSSGARSRPIRPAGVGALLQ